MLTPRIVLGAVVLFAMVRFFMSPTWPCTLMALGAIAIAAAYEGVGLWRQHTHLSALEAKVSEIRAEASELSDRISALERGRALGGM